VLHAPGLSDDVARLALMAPGRGVAEVSRARSDSPHAATAGSREAPAESSRERRAAT